MSYKKSQLLQDLHHLEDDNFEPQTLHHLAMLRLNPTTPSPSTTTTSKPHPRFKKCSQCGTLKRRSPSLQEPSPKKPNLQSTTTTISPTWNITPPKQQPLNRSLSVPTYSETEKMNEQTVVNALSPENSKTPTTASSPSSAVAGPILRSISDPTVVTTSPPLPHVSRTHTRLSPVSEESPNSRRVRRMKKRMKEMSKWVGEVMKEDDEEEEDGDHVSEVLHTTTNSKDENECEHQEAVWVEKKGDGLVIHFKCPCGEGYEIFICGNNCYYKLM